MNLKDWSSSRGDSLVRCQTMRLPNGERAVARHMNGADSYLWDSINDSALKDGIARMMQAHDKEQQKKYNEYSYLLRRANMDAAVLQDRINTLNSKLRRLRKIVGYMLRRFTCER